jgi:DNA polymerase-3 subunit gamma/tau
MPARAKDRLAMTSESDMPEGAPALLDEPGLPGFAPPAPTAAEGGAYRVLARKYRPIHFGDLIGQEPMVRTLTNSFRAGRIPQAWMLTGVRGVGKTTTARILARGLNFLRADGSGGPTTDLTEFGVHCQAIIEGRHIDVMEIDAASNNGVDNIRQINEAVRYAPVSARYKVYIIDEVHMLSGGAFNAFLKTLEEPPPHAKFVLATTEIRKVPVTVLSRCQRFDLRRVDAGLLVSHLSGICAREGVAVDDAALAMIARAAEGSVRDALSLLDQAIAHGAGRLDAETVRAMLGLADRARIVDLFAMVARGELAAALDELRGQYDEGADPFTVISELGGFIHVVTRLKVTPAAAKDPSLTDVERERGLAFAEGLSIRLLSMLWQVALKGLGEVKDSPRPLAAAEMLLVRLCHAAELPTPDEALKALRDGAPGSPAASPSASGPAGAGPSAVGPSGGPVARMTGGGPSPARRQDIARAEPLRAPVAAPRLASFAALVALAGEKRDLQLKRALEHDVRPVRFEEGRLEVALEPGAPRQLVNQLSQKLREWTGRPWMVALAAREASEAAAPPTLREIRSAARAEALRRAEAHPAVQAALAHFAGARIADVLPRGQNVPDDAGRDAEAGEGAAVEADDLPYQMDEAAWSPETDFDPEAGFDSDI